MKLTKRRSHFLSPLPLLDLLLLLLHCSSPSGGSSDHPNALVLYRRQARKRPIQRVLGLRTPHVVDVDETALDLWHTLQFNLQSQTRVVAHAQRRVRVHHLKRVFLREEEEQEEKKNKERA